MKSVFKIKFLKNILIISSLIAVGLPLFVILFIYPLFHGLLIKNTENMVISIARHLSSNIIGTQDILSRNFITKEILSEIQGPVNHFGLMNLQIFSESGEIVFSTVPEEIGEINKKTYFHDFVAKGKVYTKVVKKGTKSSEDQIVKADVLETYIPIIKNDKFIGAFEIYYDITDRKKRLDKLLYTSSLILILLAISLQYTIIISLLKAGRNIIKREKAEQLRDVLISDLQKALAKVKTLSGMLPICAQCKKIRDDKGYWNQIEVYIRDHSEAEFSHGMCPECSDKLYGKEDWYIEMKKEEKQKE
ncbi:MAG: hypothetical protein KKD21_15315 [Proteobacteria bacterium]|nr:hypothetical protein [Pseudomonadota bacterium]